MHLDRYYIILGLAEICSNACLVYGYTSVYEPCSCFYLLAQ
jgi:hypothetical protein